MAERNRVPEVAELPIPIAQPPPPRIHPTMQAGPEPAPEELHGTIGPARSPLEAPALSAESRLAEAAENALLSTAAASSLPAMISSDAANLKVNGPAAAALGFMTYGRSAARLADPRRALRSLARNPNYGAHALKRRTGYERGLFGLGVETHGDATLKPSTLFAPRRVEGRMRDLAYMHRDVEIAYPGMENIPVRIIPDAEWRAYVDTARVPAAQRPQAYGANGFLEHGNGITIRGRLPDETMSQWFSRADDTLVHEMQHIAQEADAIRAPYARPTREAYLADAREVEARNTAGRRVFSGDERYQFLRRATQDMPAEAVNLDDKGGENNFGSFTNFLASDDVPESLFGIPIVQDESQYTERDIEFFKENPKAAGFYDMGDEEDMGSQEAWGGANTVERVTYDLPKPEPEPVPRERPVIQAAETAPRAVLSTPSPVRIFGSDEEEFWRTIPGANSVIPEMRAYARSPENLLPEELARLNDIRLRESAMETGAALAMGASPQAKAAPVLLNDFRTGKYYRVPSLQVSEADIEAAARHFEKPASRIMPSDYAAWVNYELNGRKLYQYSQNVLGSDADVAIMNQPADIARRLMRMKGSASVDAFRSAGIRQISVLPRVRPVTPLSSDPPVLSPVEYQAWRDLRVLPLSSFYGNAYEAGVRTPFRASTHVDMLTPFRRLPASGGRDYLEVLSEYDGLPLATKNAVREGLAHQHFIDLHVDPGAEVQAVRFGWQDKLNDPNVFLGGRSINPDTVFGGRLKAATENDKGGSTRAGTDAGGADKAPTRRYIVRPGDTLTKISETTKVPAADIVRFSRLKDPDKLTVGQSLMLVEPYPGSWNNPGNVKLGKVEYEGETGSVKSKISNDGSSFLTFDTPEHGLNAKGQVVGQMVREKIPDYHKKGRLPSDKFTVANLVNVYAPTNDHNNTTEYIKFVADRLGVGKDDVLDMTDVKRMAALLEAIAIRDSGQDKAGWFHKSDYLNAAKKMPIPAKPRKPPTKGKAKTKAVKK